MEQIQEQLKRLEEADKLLAQTKNKLNQAIEDADRRKKRVDIEDEDEQVITSDTEIIPDVLTELPLNEEEKLMPLPDIHTEKIIPDVLTELPLNEEEKLMPLPDIHTEEKIPDITTELPLNEEDMPMPFSDTNIKEKTPGIGTEPKPGKEGRSEVLFNMYTKEIPAEVVEIIPESMARILDIMPVSVTEDTLYVAMASGDDIWTQQVVAAFVRMRVEPVVATLEDIRKLIDRNYKSYDEIEEQLSNVSAHYTKAREEIIEETTKDAPVIKASEMIVNEAVKNRASDIHIEPKEDRLRVRYRIDGVLHETMSLPLSAHAPLISRLKIQAGMNIADHRPQDGRFSVKVRKVDVDVRVATINTAMGEMAVMRILDKSFANRSMEQLGLSTANLERYKKMLRSPYGMVLVSGPTGSGKTTTLYASLNSLDQHARNIITVEDPVEYRFGNINQIQVNIRAGLTFASGLRSIMRHDPDVIMVGEIRDPETAEIAVQAALTGHLVLASVHANDTVGSISRLLDLGIQPFLVSSALIGVVAQRMVRCVCHYCRQPGKASMEGQVAYKQEMGEERKEFQHGTGCHSCSQTGFLGRTAAFEVLTMSDSTRKILLDGADAIRMRKQAQEDGMTTMWHDAMLKVKDGISTPDEVIKNVFSIG